MRRTFIMSVPKSACTRFYLCHSWQRSPPPATRHQHVHMCPHLSMFFPPRSVCSNLTSLVGGCEDGEQQVERCLQDWVQPRWPSPQGNVVQWKQRRCSTSGPPCQNKSLGGNLVGRRLDCWCDDGSVQYADPGASMCRNIRYYKYITCKILLD